MTIEEQPAQKSLTPSEISVPAIDSSSNDATETTGLLNRTNDRVSQKFVSSTDLSQPQFWLLFGCVMVGSLLAFFDGTVMASSHPVITSYFKASNSASWLTTSFFLASTISQPLYGRTSDIIGRRPVLLFALVVFFVSNSCCALANDIWSFIAARFVCGIGAGGVTTMTVILISDLVKLEHRGIFQSYYNVAWGCGNGLGGALGGLLCDRLGWRAIFGIQLPFIFIDGIVAFIVTPNDLGPNLAKSNGDTLSQALQDMDIPGCIALTVTLTCLIVGINLGGNVLSWQHPIVIAALMLCSATLFILILVERRDIRRPILPLPFLVSYPVANLMWSNFLSAIVINSIIFNVPIFLQAVRQASPTVSGLYLISPLIAASVMGTFSGLWIAWIRTMKPLLATGALFFLLGAIGATLLAFSTPQWAIPLLISGASIGQGLNWPATTIALLALNPQAEQAVVSTTQGMLRSIGTILGVAVSSWIFQNALSFFLDRIVTASSDEIKQAIIRTVRESVKAISTLDSKHKDQAINAYSAALRVTFASTIVVAVVVICITLALDLPDLQAKQNSNNSVVNEDNEAEAINDPNSEGCDASNDSSTLSRD